MKWHTRPVTSVPFANNKALSTAFFASLAPLVALTLFSSMASGVQHFNNERM